MASVQSAAEEHHKRVAIFGFAGGHMSVEHTAQLSGQLFEQMVNRAYTTITELWGLDLCRVHLVSGGAAWADQVAVELYNRHQHSSPGLALTLVMPCEWSAGTCRFVDSKGSSSSWRENPGRLSNSYHERFSRVCTGLPRHSQEAIKAAVEAGAKLDCQHRGFHRRNTAIAELAQYALAFSWAEADRPYSGGTLDTFNKLRAECHRSHVSMVELAASAKPVKRAAEPTEECSKRRAN
jgi:hypothetical protein